MTTLGSYHHDFPHLAKQSGFFFHLHRGKVNWTEIENLNLSDITENRNFHLLEENLVNVINCNLEKEYDLKILDKNFVKLFKLAQLGVDYLSYCETYLDKCVIILQEQLLACQEECKSLKYEKEKRKEEGSRIKRKNNTQCYQCEKCDKAFISDVYLKFHDKRRHSSPNTPKSVDSSLKRCSDNCQQTENSSKTSTSTQTVFLNDREPTSPIEENAEKMKAQHAEKFENLEQEIHRLKERLRRAENALTEKAEASKSTVCHSPFSGSMCHNTMLLLLSPHQAQSGCQEVNPGYLVPDPKILQPNCSLIQVPVNKETEESKPPPENSCRVGLAPEKAQCEAGGDSQREGTKIDAGEKGVENSEKLNREGRERLECDKENIDPNRDAAKLSRPSPPPRKSKRLIPRRLGTENSAPTESIQCKSESENLISPLLVRSTPIKDGSPVKINAEVVEGFPESISDIHKRQSTSSESLGSRKNDSADDPPKSFFKTIVRRNSPKFQLFRRNLRRSLTNLCESVSSTRRDLMKESVDQSAKAAVVEGLNGQLRELGVDPQWSGIPKKTMKQKLRILKHRRKLLTKENPMYPIIRQNIEEKIFRKLRKNLENKKVDLMKKLSKESASADDAGTPEPILEDEAECAKTQKCVMYDIESDSDSEINLDELVTGEKNSQKGSETVEKEFDLTVFQVGRGSFDKIKEKEISVKVEELTDSDTDGDLSDEKTIKTLNGFLSDARVEISQDEERGDRIGCLFPRQDKPENQSILKSTDGFQSKLQMNAKKVWFRNSSNDIEEGLSDSPTDDWSLSDWEKDAG